MLIVPEGRFIPVNMDRCQDLMGGLFEHVKPEMVVEDHGDTGVKGVGLDHLEGMEQWDQRDPLDQGDSQEGMDYPPLGVHSLPWDWEYPLLSMQT